MERAVKLLRDNIIGKTIQNVWTKDDSLVFSNIKHDAFVRLDINFLIYRIMTLEEKASEVRGRNVRNVARYGLIEYSVYHILFIELQ